MRTSILVATFGEPIWKRRAERLALPSTVGQGALEVLTHHEPEGTLASARNNAAARAEGDWLCFLDADDALGPRYLEPMEAALARREGRFLLTPAVSYGKGKAQQRARIMPRVDLRHGNYLVIGTLVQREVFEEVGGFKDWPLYEDYDFFARCWIAGAEVVEVPGAVYRASVRVGSRNRAPRRSEKLYWHQAIAHSLWPELWAAPTEREHAERALVGVRLRSAA